VRTANSSGTLPVHENTSCNSIVADSGNVRQPKIPWFFLKIPDIPGIIRPEGNNFPGNDRIYGRIPSDSAIFFSGEKSVPSDKNPPI